VSGTDATGPHARDARGAAGHRVVMITSSYPRFPGDTVGTFLEPIAHGIAERGHEVHVVLPAHPLLARPAREGRVHFHPFRYAPVRALNVFGYAGGLKADVRLRFAAVAAAPFALAAAWQTARRVARSVDATIVHAHWVIPCGAVGAAMAGGRPLVVSLHGSDVFVAERHAAIGRVARATFRRCSWVTACSDDLRSRAVALGAADARSETIPYGVDAGRFKPDAAARLRRRSGLGLDAHQPVLFTAGRLVRKKGFEYLVDAMPDLSGRCPDLRLVIGGSGDLDTELRSRAAALGVGNRVLFAGPLKQGEVAEWLAAADVAVVPSVKDDSGNVDGLPNVVMEALASGTALVTTDAGGIASVVCNGENALLTPQRDPAALAQAVGMLLADDALRARIGETARRLVLERHSWARVAETFERAYARAAACPSSDGHAMV
jgi:glycosyltransferase involved in cell wall biosynthesis